MIKAGAGLVIVSTNTDVYQRGVRLALLALLLNLFAITVC